MSIKEVKYLTKFPLEELIGSLMTHEINMNNHQEVEVKIKIKIGMTFNTSTIYHEKD